MPRPFIPLSVPQFAELLSKFTFTRPVREVHVHGTWRPNYAQERGLASIESMFLFHTQTNGWSDIAQHLTIDSRGTIWTGRSWNQVPASATGHNTGAFMFEMIGDFNKGKDVITDAQRLTAHLVTAFVLRKCNLGLDNVRFHREFTNLKTCPGTSLSLSDFRQGVQKQLANFPEGDSVIFDDSDSSFNASDDPANLENARKVRDLLLEFLNTQPAPTAADSENAELDCGSYSDSAEADEGNAGEFDLPAEMFRSNGSFEPTNIVMNRRFIGPINVPVQFTEVDGMAMYEGDIVLTDDVEEARKANQDGSKGVGIVGSAFRWPDGKVPYVMKDGLDDTVKRAIQHWMDRTPFKFVKRTNEADFISFERRGGCFSNVGRKGGMQVISIGNGCSLGSAIHEIGHALGLWHEQSRSDRDQFIKINFDNIDPAARNNFNKHVLDGKDLGAYDFGSIMHYPAFAFAIDPSKPTIVTPGGQPIGQRNGLSKGDIAAIRLLYPALNWAPFT